MLRKSDWFVKVLIERSEVLVVRSDKLIKILILGHNKLVKELIVESNKLKY